MTTSPARGDTPREPRNTRGGACRRSATVLLASLIFAGLCGSAALADDHDRDRGPPPRHDVRHDDRRDVHRPPVYGYDAPNYVPVPPPVVYGPPPLPPVLNFSLNIR